MGIPLQPEHSKDRIVLCYPVEKRHLGSYREAFPQAEIVDAGQARIASEILDADVFIGHAKVPVDWERVVENRRLKLIQSSAAGLDHCLKPPVIASDIPVCSASGLFANQVGEQSLALILGLMRSLPTFFRQGQQKEFVRRPTDDLHGKRVGIVGLGGNGRRLAQILKPFSVEIFATDHFPVRKPAEVDQLWPEDRLLELASRSDILILCLPLNAKTKQLVSAEVLKALPVGSYLINVARGQVVDELALIDELESGHLAGAGIDVTYEEPLPKTSRLWDLPNVIITPHVGAQSARRVDDSTALAIDNLKRSYAGEKLLNIVDKQLGFPHPDDMVMNQ